MLHQCYKRYAVMKTQDYEHNDEIRSSIWTVSSTDLAKFFLVYTLVYANGSGLLIW